MANVHKTILAMVERLNNPSMEGGFWLPNIQRKFVWEPEQIERLFDSVMRRYPIGTLLVWKTKSKIRHRKFIEKYDAKEDQRVYAVPDNADLKNMVLDGQQRLQSFFIGIRGSYQGKILCFNVLSGELKTPDDIRYEFKFKKQEQIAFPYVSVHSMVCNTKQPTHIAKEIYGMDNTLSEQKKDTILDNVVQLVTVLKGEESLVYQELDGSSDNDATYDEDAIVEIFIRANSGGTKLGRSDLLFSLLSSDWGDAEDNVETLRDQLNAYGYNFTRDFILKTALVVLKMKALYKVEKFRDPLFREEVRNNWDRIAAALKDVCDFLHDNTYLRADKAIPSYMCLMPLVYFRYHYPKKWKKVNKSEVADYIIRAMLCGTFSFASDTGIDNAVETIVGDEDFNRDEQFKKFANAGRAVAITSDELLTYGYGAKNIHLIFSLWYRDFNYKPAYSNNMPQVDHIFAQAILEGVKDINPETGKRNIKRYKKCEQDQLANCMLLTQKENGPSGKGDKTPEEWFADKDDAYLDMHLIPKDRNLWKVENYRDFIEARKKLILQKFAPYLAQSIMSD